MGKRYLPVQGLQREYDEATGAFLRLIDDQKNVIVANVPLRSSGWKNGECLAVGTGQTLNTTDMAEGVVLSLYNDSDSSFTLTQGAGVTLRWGTSTGNRTIAARTLVTIWCKSGSEAVIPGPGVS